MTVIKKFSSSKSYSHRKLLSRVSVSVLALSGALLSFPAVSFGQTLPCGSYSGSLSDPVYCYKTSGQGAASVSLLGATSDVTVNSMGIVYAASLDSHATVTVNDFTGSISPPTAMSSGFRAVAGPASTGDAVINLSGNNHLTLDAMGDTAFIAYNGGSGDAVINVTGILNVYNNVSSSGVLNNERDGLEVMTVSGNARINHQGSGIIRTQLGSAILGRTATGNVDLQIGQNVILEVNNVVGGRTDGSISGIYATATGAGNISVDTGAVISTTGNGSHGINSVAVTGETTLVNTGSITVTGQNSAGMSASSTIGDITIENGGSIRSYNDNGAGIRAQTTTGNIKITNAGTILTGDSAAGTGISNHGIRAIANGSGAISVDNTGDITTEGYRNSTGIAISQNGTGDVDVRSIGANITTSGSGLFNNGIAIIVNNGAGNILFADGTVKVSGQSAGLSVWNNGSSLPGTANIVVRNGNIDGRGSFGHYGIEASAQTEAHISVDASSTIHGGWNNGGLIGVGVVLNAEKQSLINNGTIDALSDVAVVGDNGGISGTLSVTNTGSITGSVTASQSSVTFDNNGIWNLRSFADTDGDGVRDHFAVAVNNLGTSGNNTITNNGTIRVLGHDHQALTLDTTGMYLPQGNANNTMSLSSPTQAHILGANTFINNGIIDMTANADAGDVLVITGGQTAGIYGGGNFITGGSLRINTLLNEGGVNSRSDVLVVDNVVHGTGASVVYVQGTGSGAQTVDNGILVVEALGTRSDAGAFTLGNRVVGGLYEYGLYQVGANWYLQSDGYRDETAVTPVITGGMVNMGALMIASNSVRSSSIIYRETSGSEYGWCRDPKDHPYNEKLKYLCRIEPEQHIYRGAWGRVLGETGKQDSGNFAKHGARTDWNQYGLQVGADLFGYDGNDGSQGLLGLYFGYARNNTDVKGNRIGSSGKVGSVELDGYSVGAYWTHFGSTGWYVDSVIQGSYYEMDQKINRSNTSSADGFGFAASVEGGYKFEFDNGFMLEPQAQLMWQFVSLDSFDDGYSRVSLDDVNSLRGRIGLKGGYTFEGNTPVKVWALANIWKDFSSDSKTSFYDYNGLLQGEIKTPLDESWLEVGLGVSGQIAKNTSLVAEGSYNQGLNNSDRTSWQGTIGIKYTW